MNRIDAATGWSLGLWLVFGLGPVLYQSVDWQSIISNQGLAAWAQAIGSILAIFGAVWVGSAQARHAEKLFRAGRLEDHIERAGRLWIAADRLAIAIGEAGEYSDDDQALHTFLGFALRPAEVERMVVELEDLLRGHQPVTGAFLAAARVPDAARGCTELLSSLRLYLPPYAEEASRLVSLYERRFRVLKTATLDIAQAIRSMRDEQLGL